MQAGNRKTRGEILHHSGVRNKATGREVGLSYRVKKSADKGRRDEQWPLVILNVDGQLTTSIISNT